MAGTSNYGSTWTFNAASYKCIVTGFPELTTDELDATNHSSGGYAESVPSGLIRVGRVGKLCDISDRNGKQDRRKLGD